MTSKNALEDIILYLNATAPKGLYCENIEAIKKDLEVLDILKGISGFMSVKFFVKHLTKEQWIKVKEWLINE